MSRNFMKEALPSQNMSVIVEGLNHYSELFCEIINGTSKGDSILVCASMLNIIDALEATLPGVKSVAMELNKNVGCCSAIAFTSNTDETGR